MLLISSHGLPVRSCNHLDCILVRITLQTTLQTTHTRSWALFLWMHLSICLASVQPHCTISMILTSFLPLLTTKLFEIYHKFDGNIFYAYAKTFLGSNSIILDGSYDFDYGDINVGLTYDTTKDYVHFSKCHFIQQRHWPRTQFQKVY